MREVKNRSGSVRIQIVSRQNGKYKAGKTVGCSTMYPQIEALKIQAKKELEELRFGKNQLFLSEQDEIVERTMQALSNSSIRTVGPELVFGKIYDFIGFGNIGEELFRHLVVSRLAFPLSKLKTVEYLYRYQGVLLDMDKAYRFLDKLNDSLKLSVEKTAFNRAKKRLNGRANASYYNIF